MKIEEFKKEFENNFDNLFKIINEVLSQITGKEYKVKYAIEGVASLLPEYIDFEYPFLALKFKIESSKVFNNVILLNQEFSNFLYSMLLGEGNEDMQLSEETCDGIKEIFNQVFGQIRTNLKDGEKINATDIDVQIIAKSTYLDGIEKTDSNFLVTYSLKAEELNFRVFHYISYEKVSKTEKGGDKIEVSEAEFRNLVEEKVVEETTNMDILMDVELEIVAELGRKILPIRDLLRLGKGSVVELDKAAGEPLDIYVNGRKFAEGEVVVVDDAFGIRITQFTSNNRMKR
ncbi:MAG: flagellar motor switch protein FliN [Candidatus Marinimicrobia bacterium]|nr:flagellar motor switch protein FliN [Candidatus Neomarinimicrobiota bacterium]